MTHANSPLTPQVASPRSRVSPGRGSQPTKAIFAGQDIRRITRVVTDNGPNYRARDFTRTVLSTAAKHQWIRPRALKHNVKIERCDQTRSEGQFPTGHAALRTLYLVTRSRRTPEVQD